MLLRRILTIINIELLSKLIYNIENICRNFLHINTMTNKYKFIKYLGKGTSSSIDLVEDENGHTLVIKHCNMENKNAWKEECLKEIAITSSLAQTNINCSFPWLNLF